MPDGAKMTSAHTRLQTGPSIDWGNTARALCCLAIAAASGSAPSHAQQKMLSVDWKAPEIRTFVEEAKSGTRSSAMAQDEGRLSKLQLPVLGFARAPAQLTRSLGTSAAPAPDRKLMMDEENPVWYTIIERYEGITISVDADLRLQDELPPSAKVFGKLPTPDSTTKVSVIDGTTEPGMEGAVAEYTVYKYPNIPYRVTIECEKKAIDYCRNPSSITKDSETLKLISVGRPTDRD